MFVFILYLVKKYQAMPITASVKVEQQSDPSSFIVIDDTPDEDTETFTGRTLTITDSVGNPLDDYPNPIDFSFDDYPDNEIEITGLENDLALTVQMNLIASPTVGGSVYVATIQVATNRYLQRGVYDIQASRFLENGLPGLAGNEAQKNSIDILIEIENSQTAVQYEALIGAQQALNRGQRIINNQLL